MPGEGVYRNAQNCVSAYGMVQTYGSHTVVFHQDTQPDAVYLIEHGMVKMVRILEKGQPIIVGIRRRHWLIGGPSVLLNKRYSFTAITLVSSSLRCIPARVFLDLVKTNEEFSWYLHEQLSEEIINQMKNAEARNCLSAKDRMKRFLRDMIEEQHLAGKPPASYSLPLTNKEFSQLLAITPEHFCRMLKEMKQEGLIRAAKGVLTVVDPSSFL